MIFQVCTNVIQASIAVESEFDRRWVREWGRPGGVTGGKSNHEDTVWSSSI